MMFLDLFAGIGGFSLGLERAGMQCVGQVEIDEYCQAVLRKHWPNVPKWRDIYEFKGSECGAVDLVCGGFPCQPFSCAGKRSGKKDDRYLWPEMLRVIKTLRPAWVFGENVVNIDGLVLDQVYLDLEGIGFEIAPPLEIPAVAVGAPHLRFRTWIVAHSENSRLERTKSTRNSCAAGLPTECCSSLADTGRKRYRKPEASLQSRRAGTIRRGWWAVEPDVGRVAHGVPRRVDRIKALGNAVVPQVVEIIGKAIMEADVQ